MLTLPALAGEFLHVSDSPVQPFKMEDPPNHNMVAAYERGTDAFRRDGLRPREQPALIGDMSIPPHAWHALVFPHRSIRGVELLDGLGMRVLLHPGDEAFQSLGT